MAAQVQPSLLDIELVDMFMDSLQSSYFERMVGIVSSNLYGLVKYGEHIERVLKNEKSKMPQASRLAIMNPLAILKRKKRMKLMQSWKMLSILMVHQQNLMVIHLFRRHHF